MVRLRFKVIKPELNVSLSDDAFNQPVDPRRRPEYADAQMIHEDQNAIANLPNQEINRQFDAGRYQPHYWMESEIRPFGVERYNESEDMLVEEL